MKVIATAILAFLSSVLVLASATVDETELHVHQLNGGPLTDFVAKSNELTVVDSSSSSKLRSRVHAGRVKGSTISTNDKQARRDLQKGPPPPPPPYYYPQSKVGPGGSGSCDTVTVYYEESTFKKSFLPIGGNAGGANNNVPLYDAKTGKRLALYTEVSIAYGPVDCYVQGSFTFDTSDNGKATDQLYTTSTCFSIADAVVGGIGTFTCAGGVVKRLNRGSKAKQFFEISVCAGSC